MGNEVVLMTETRRKIEDRRKARAVSAEKVFSLDTLASSAEVLARCGGQAALVFRAIVGSYTISKPEMRNGGFKIHPVFAKAINLPARQLQRATQRLEDGGYIEREIEPGKKMRIRLTEQGKRSLAQQRGMKSTNSEEVRDGE